MTELEEQAIQLYVDCLPNNIKELVKEAIEQGYKNEICSKCRNILLANQHFIMCHEEPCPMKSTKDPRSVLEMMLDPDNESREKE